MIGRIRFLRRLRRNERGTAFMEFALTAPMFLLLLMGIFDYSWQMYANQVLQGAVSISARAATLETNSGTQAALDTAVRTKVQRIFHDANVTFKRTAYESYDQIGDPEPFTDKNNNGRYDSGECFEDMNSNGNWDSDRGTAGNGGAEDVVLYTASMKFKRVLPVWNMLGQSQETTLSATTVLRNQPYNINTSSSKIICT